MITLHSEHAEGVADGMRRSLLVPGDGSQFFPREIHLVSADDRIVAYALISRVESGSLKHWTHEPGTLSDYGCATPHELADRLKRYYPKHKFKSDQEHWTKLAFAVLDDWQDTDPQNMSRALFALKFKTGVGKSL